MSQMIKRGCVGEFKVWQTSNFHALLRMGYEQHTLNTASNNSHHNESVLNLEAHVCVGVVDLRQVLCELQRPCQARLHRANMH